MLKTYDDYRTQALALADAARTAQTRLYRFLAVWEASNTWQQGGYKDFDMLISRNGLKLCQPEHYREFLAALPKVVQALPAAVRPQSDAVVDSLGAAVVTEAAKISDLGKRKEYVASMRDYVDREGMAPSKEWAENRRCKVQPDSDYKPLDQRRMSRVQQLENEVKKLRDQNRVLRQENAQLKAQVRKMSGPSARAARAVRDGVAPA